ncbi:hypothetical protein HC928_09280 [bacterium]|nr:hypothetical protein [bacterium]
MLFWLCLSFIFSLALAQAGWEEGFQAAYVVQDDARQHVFWMQRFIDPELFPNDLIADYFQSVAPLGYTKLYQFFVSLGIDLFLFNKLLAAALGLFVTAWTFALIMLLMPVPFAGFCTTWALNITLWMKDDLVSGTPRAFVYPMAIVFLYCLLKKWVIPCAIVIVLTGWFYPQYVLVEAGIMGIQLLWYRRDYRLYALGLGVAFIVLLPYALSTDGYGEVITRAEAINMPEFWRRGRSEFFHEDPLQFWIFGDRSGFFTKPKRFPLILWTAVLLPIFQRFPKQFPLIKCLDKRIVILVHILLASLVLFFLAHLLLFDLHLPSRYTRYNLPVLLSIATGLSIAIGTDALLQIQVNHRLISGLKQGAIAFLALTLIIVYPMTVEEFPNTNYSTGKAPEFYPFFRSQPKDTLIASLSEEANNLPSFVGRSVLFGREYAIPYHTGYYSKLRDRAIALVEAQYSLDPAILKEFIQTYNVDFWLLDRDAFTPAYILDNDWLKGFQTSKFISDPLVQVTQVAFLHLEQGKPPALSSTINSCTVQGTATHLVLDTACILNILGG